VRVSGLPFTRLERRALSRRIRKAYETQFGQGQKGTGFVRMASALAGKRMNRAKAWSWVVEFVLSPRPRQESFYQSEAWREARYKALRHSDGRCQLCGRSKRADGVILHVDHIKPRSRFPELALDVANLQVLCEDCNLGKGNSDTVDWRGPQCQ